MSGLFKINTAAHVPYPDSDMERLELIFKYLFDEDPHQRFLFQHIIYHYGWNNMPPSDIVRVENLVATSGLVTPFKQSMLQMLWLNDEGKRILGQFDGSYSRFKKYISDKQAEKENFTEQLAKMQAENLELQNDRLKYDKTIRVLEENLKDAQFHLTQIQTNLDSLHLDDYLKTKNDAEETLVLAKKALRKTTTANILLAITAIVPIIVLALHYWHVWFF